MKRENTTSFSSDLDLAHYLADLASKLALSYFRKNIKYHTKSDGTPVTQVDLEVEKTIRNVLFKERPNDSVLGEEFNQNDAMSINNSNRRWILDPIDGTSEFIAGKDHWGTHIALEENGSVILGLITRPTLDRRWWATKNGGAYHSSSNLKITKPVVLSPTSKLENSKITIWEQSLTARVLRLKKMGIWIQPSISNIIEFLDGQIDVFVDVIGKPWDHAPVAIIVEEAGGIFQDHQGGRRIDIGEVRYTNGKFNKELVQILNISSENE